MAARRRRGLRVVVVNSLQLQHDCAFRDSWSGHTSFAGILGDPLPCCPTYTLPSIQAAAASFAVQVNAAPVHAKDDIECVIAAQTRDPGGGLIVIPNVFDDAN